MKTNKNSIVIVLETMALTPRGRAPQVALLFEGGCPSNALGPTAALASVRISTWSPEPTQAYRVQVPYSRFCLQETSISISRPLCPHSFPVRAGNMKTRSPKQGK